MKVSVSRKSVLKRFFIIVLCLALQFSLAACGGTGSVENKILCHSCSKEIPSGNNFCSYCGAATQAGLNTEKPSTKPEGIPSAEPSPEPTPEAIKEQPGWCEILGDEFSEGLVLSAYIPKGETKYRVGVLNQEGQIIPVDGIPAFTDVSSSAMTGAVRLIKSSPFYDGKCYATLVDDDDERHVYCIYADGNLEEIWNEEANTTYEYLASGDGLHLFKQMIKSYNTNEENIVIFDQTTNQAAAVVETTGTYTYHGEGFFSLMSGELHKIRLDFSEGLAGGVVKDAIISANVVPGVENGRDEHYTEAVFSGVFNGEAIVSFCDSWWGNQFYKVNDQGEWELLENGSIVRSDLHGDRIFILHKTNKSGYYFLEIRDLDGNTIFYETDFCVSDISGYSEDACILTIKGSDGEKYVTVIDRDGNFAFDPIKLDAGSVTSRLGEGYFIASKKRGDELFPADFDIISVTGDVISYNVKEVHGVWYPEFRSAIFQNGVAIIHDIDSKYGLDFLFTVTGDVIFPWFEVQQ